MKHLTVKQLKKYLQTLDDDAVLVRDRGDHSFVPINLTYHSVLQDTKFSYTEDYGEDMTPIRDYIARVNALVIS